MEEGKVDWSDTVKIDRIRRAHAQRAPPQKLNLKQCPVVFIKGEPVKKIEITKLAKFFIHMFAPPAFRWGKNTDIWLKIAEYLLKLKKTSRALPIGSANKCN